MDDRIHTFIHGFDELIGGGLPKGQIVLVSGEPGTLKSTFCFNIVYHNAVKENKNGAYITLEQGRENFSRHLRVVGMDPRQVEERVSIVDLGMIRKNLEGIGTKTWLDIFKMYAQNLRKNIGYDILVIDSLPVLETIANFQKPREDLFQFFEWLRGLDSTILVISEIKANAHDYGAHGEDFLADAIVHLKMERVNDSNIQRRVRVVKMRASPHSPNYHTVLFQNGGLQVTRVIAE
jgi:KaiC/GvpD/RAD55 family RecA-like ATPase